MTRGVFWALPLLCCPFPAAANDPGQEVYMIRMLSCKGTDANMEVYIPQSIALSGPALARALAQPVIGYYALDLSEVGFPRGHGSHPLRRNCNRDTAETRAGKAGGRP